MSDNPRPIEVTQLGDRAALMVENIVDYMATSRCGNGGLGTFDSAIPFLPEFLEETGSHPGASHVDESDILLALSDLTRLPPLANMNVAWLSPVKGRDEAGAYKFAASAVRTVSRRAARGARRLFPTMVEHHVAIIHRGATHQYGKRFLGWAGGRWHWADSPHPYAHVERQFVLGCGLAVYLQQEIERGWHVVLGYDDAPGIRFASSPAGAIECFRLRDIPNGKSRRAALLHWVNAHWRRSLSAADEQSAVVEVRKHLRGQRSFSWNGLRCEIVPSPADEILIRKA